MISVADPKGKVSSVEGACRGKISFEMRGSHGNGYDTIFVPDGYRMTMAEMDPEIKNQISHRADAMRKFREAMGDFLAGEKK